MIIALTLGALVATAAPADLQTAQDAFEEGNFDAAIGTLDRLVAAKPTDAALLGQAQLLRGRCFGAKGKLKDAERAFALALEANPEAQLDPENVPPQLVKLLADQRASLAARLVAKADREDATVRLDGRELGKAPLDAAVPIGRHTLEVKTADGRYGETKEVVLFPRAVYDITFALRDLAPPVLPPAPTPLPVNPTPVRPSAPVVQAQGSGGVSTRTVGIALDVAAVLILVGGVITDQLALADNDRARTLALQGGDPQPFNGAINDFHTKRTTAGVLLGVGAAAAIAGVVLTVLPVGKTEAARVGIAPVPGGAVVAVGGGF